jgi:hypothetical protein
VFFEITVATSYPSIVNLTIYYNSYVQARKPQAKLINRSTHLKPKLLVADNVARITNGCVWDTKLKKVKNDAEEMALPFRLTEAKS